MPVLEIKKKKESLTEIKNITAVSEFLEHGKVSWVPVGRRLLGLQSTWTYLPLIIDKDQN